MRNLASLNLQQYASILIWSKISWAGCYASVIVQMIPLFAQNTRLIIVDWANLAIRNFAYTCCHIKRFIGCYHTHSLNQGILTTTVEQRAFSSTSNTLRRYIKKISWVAASANRSYTAHARKRTTQATVRNYVKGHLNWAA